MFEAMIYDERDKDSKCPESTLGTFQTRVEAWAAIIAYLTSRNTAQHCPRIYKAEVLPALH